MPGRGPASAGRPAAPKTARRVHRRRRLRSRNWVRFTLMTVLVAGCSAAAVILAPGLAAISSHTGGTNRLDAFLTAAGLGIDEVTVSGHRYTADSDIFDALDLPNTPSVASLNRGQVQARIRRLPWIATASLTSVYPGRIDVAVTERTPYAAWTNGQTTGGAVILVDQTGRELAPVRDTGWPALPRIQGAGAPAEAANLFQTLAHFPLIAARLERAERITNRRWQLHLTGAVRIELPPEGEAAALSSLLSSRTAAPYLDRPGAVVDLRSPARIAARIERAPTGGP